MCLDRDKIGADGIYWDELDWISTKYTFDRWDGHSAILDAQYRIRKKMACVHLLSLSAKVNLIQYIHAKGGILIGNSVATSDTLTRLHFPRFVDRRRVVPRPIPPLLADLAGRSPDGEGFFGPVGRHSCQADVGNGLLLLRGSQAALRHDTQHMFPFTPVELHRGWLIGKERIITAVPGTFTLGDLCQGGSTGMMLREF